MFKIENVYNEKMTKTGHFQSFWVIFGGFKLIWETKKFLKNVRCSAPNALSVNNFHLVIFHLQSQNLINCQKILKLQFSLIFSPF